jgi:hypothetical protein
MSVAATVKKVADTVRKFFLPPNNIQRKEFKSVDWWATIPIGHVPNDLLQPEYWTHTARRLRTNAMIYVRAEDGTFDGALLVTAASDSWARVQWFVLNIRDEPMAIDPTPEYDLYKIDHISTGWRVINKATGKAMVDKLPLRIDAEKFIDQDIEDKRK